MQLEKGARGEGGGGIRNFFHLISFFVLSASLTKVSMDAMELLGQLKRKNGEENCGQPFKTDILKPMATTDLRTEKCPCISILIFPILIS